MSLVIILSNPSNIPIHPDLQTYLSKYRYVIAPSNAEPKDLFRIAPSDADFVLWWDASVVPQLTFGPLESYLQFDKVNVTWDSFARNYPHKVPPNKKYSKLFFGVPRICAPSLDFAPDFYDFLASAPLYRLPSDFNVRLGYREHGSARLKEVQPTLLRRFDPLTGLYR